METARDIVNKLDAIMDGELSMNDVRWLTRNIEQAISHARSEKDAEIARLRGIVKKMREPLMDGCDCPNTTHKDYSDELLCRINLALKASDGI